MKRFRTQILTAVGFMALMTTVGLWGAPRLLAAIKAALVQNVDEPGRNPYAETVSASCNNTVQCYSVFSGVPAGKRLVITNVSGSFVSSDAAAGSEVVLDDSSNLHDYELIAISQGPIIGLGGQRRTVNHTVMAFVEAGQSARVYVMVSTGTILTGTMRFSISGYLVSLP